MLRIFSTSRRALVLGVTALSAVTLAACSTDSILKADDPDVIPVSETQNANGAESLRIGAWDLYRDAMTLADAGGEGIFLASGLLADEWKSANTFTQTDEMDQRLTREDNGTAVDTYRNLHRARVATIQAIRALQKYDPAKTANLAQMYFAKGHIELQLAEAYCSGVSLGDASEATSPDNIKFGPQLPTAQLYQTAITTLDSAIAFGTAATAGAAGGNVAQAARIFKARAYLAASKDAAERTAKSHLDSALAAVNGIPTTFQYIWTFQPASGTNGIWGMNINQGRYSLGDTLGVRFGDLNSMPFASRGDPRVPGGYVRSNGTLTNSGTGAVLTGFDAGTPWSVQEIWKARDSSLAIAKGLDARLIEAEVQHAQGDFLGAFNTINALRAAVVNASTGAAAPLGGLTPALTERDRWLQIFNEKAFFQFGRGYRLGDLRRMIRYYDFAENEVFPTGEYFKGGDYGTAVNFPIPLEERNKPPVGQAAWQCLDRDA